ncbi:hypothetical protein CLV78_105292 [Aliiruegeria haliotis]|uniref:Rap1a immunity protein domain-containing protein n=1 Tax=Aliiruegeria haliotis TaxID=1280846 RepID=A0A2T0RPX1_9RHOB|nr:Rap1a/Tai family immunity protein [Aliiruegeria haliotis]PRY23236.1 hypothetical protein CLV78_105292 [Aliiruegeria haliotis]
MRKTLICSIAAVGLATIASADSHMAPSYTAKELLRPCFEADSDARDGVFAEVECEQYLVGFVDALAAVDALDGICLPEQNVADEVRWAYMRWVHGAYSARTQLPAAEAVMGALKESFACSN